MPELMINRYGTINIYKIDMKKTKKLIEVIPEWVLDNLSDSMYADGYGNMCICTNSISDSNWIHLALSTLKIHYKINNDCDFDDMLFSFEFRIGAIKIDCPSLYDRMIKLNTKSLEDKHKMGMGLN